MYDVTPSDTYSVQAPFGGVTDWYPEPRDLYELLLVLLIAFPVILISLDSLEDSLGTSTARVILFGMIPTIVPATAPTVDLPVIYDNTSLISTDTPTISPIVPTIPPIAPTIQYTSPFVCTDSSDRDTPDTPPSKSVGSLPTHRIPLRYSANYSSSDHFTSDDSSRDSLSDSSLETTSDSHSDTSSDSSLRDSSSAYTI
ncbi:hypothetical protein Tco_0643272 [Tanacetum coccineum]